MKNRRAHSRKFTPGDVIDSVDMLLLARDKGRWIFFGSLAPSHFWTRPRAYHPSWIVNMNFGCVMSYIKDGLLHLAVRNPEYPYVFKAEFMESRVSDVTSEWWVTCSELPMVRITTFTKEAAIMEAGNACGQHVGQGTKFTVQFEKTEVHVAAAPLLLK